MQKLLRIAPIVCALSVCGCAAEREARIGTLEPVVFDTVESAPEADYHILVAEIALQRGEYDVAAMEYAAAARLSNDVDLAMRATEVNFQHGSLSDAIDSAERWLGLDAEAGDARRFLVRLYLRAGDTGGAQQQLEELVRTSEPPASGDAFMNALALLSDVQERSLATRVMKRLTAQYRDSAEAQYALAALALRSGDAGLATHSARRARELKPDWTDARLLFARALVLDGDVDAGLAEARALVREAAGSAERLEYALLLGSTGHVDEARALLEEMLIEEPRDVDALRVLGLLELEAGNSEAAETHFNALLVTGRYPYEAFYYLGAIAEQREEYERALQLYTRVRAGQHVADAQIRSAQVLLALGDAEAGIRHLAEMAELLPDHAADLLAARGQLLEQIGDMDGALTAYDEGLRMHPENESLLYARAFLYERLDRVEDAVAALRRMVQARPDDAAALNALGYTLADRTDRHREALRYISKALKLDPDNPAIIDSMGWVLFKRRRYAAAIEHLERAYALAPDAEIAAHLGEVLWVSGHESKAQQVWRDALDEFPDAPAILDTMTRLGA
ncbi:MAG TPA: tetratricopeptide repeat protein [Gammaproteobacteria bacterium]|nr:tetratricopeptide repeat protein [Gammaproteobacteria bacterium]